MQLIKQAGHLREIRAGWALAVLGMLITLGFCALCSAVLMNERRVLWTATAREAMNLARASARNIARNFELYDLSLRAIVANLQQPRILALPPDLERLALFGQIGTARYFGPILVVDSAGRVTLSSTPLPAEPVNYAGAEFFQAQIQRRDTDLYISHPFRSPVDGAWRLALSRRVTRADGSFGGIVFATIDRDCFDAVFQNMELGPHGAIALALADGTLVHRLPESAARANADVGGSDAFVRSTAVRHGLVQARSPLDGIKRVSAFTHVGELPLVVSVSYALDDIYAGWWAKALQIASCVILLCFATMAFAWQLSRELKRRHAAEAELAIIARTDSLTKLHNRRGFDEALAREWQHATLHGKPLSLCLIDIDYFKAYNDFYGHQAGDEVLGRVAEALLLSLAGEGRLCARYGGEEFAALLPGVAGSEAKAAAESIRAAIEALRLVHSASSKGVVTVSIGVDTIGPPGERDAAAFVKGADMALYRAKELGRNRVEVARGPDVTTPFGAVDKAKAA